MTQRMLQRINQRIKQPRERMGRHWGECGQHTRVEGRTGAGGVRKGPGEMEAGSLKGWRERVRERVGSCSRSIEHGQC
jgi:hypothetical protein